MKRSFIYIAVAALVLCALPAQGTTLHDNYVYFDGTDYIGFLVKDHDISHGQPYHGISSNYGSGEGHIVVYAGRHGSDDVADWFNDRVDIALGTRHIGGTGSPGKLNFAIYGDLILQGSNGGQVIAKDIAIGQGHVGAYNNWWIGASDAIIREVDGRVWLECPAQEGYCAGIITLDTHASDTFKVEVWSCPTD